MGVRSPRMDAYIADAPEFARPILSTIRDIVHEACPEVVEEFKWSAPHFNYKGMLCGMSAFKAHVGFGFWKSGLVLGKGAAQENTAGQFGRLTKVSDLPSRTTLKRYIKKAMELNDAGVTIKRTPKPKPPLRVPRVLAAALARNAKARKHFEEFSPSQKREYVEWIDEAKGEDTRQRRLDSALEWISEGKTRNWKYQK